MTTYGMLLDDGDMVADSEHLVLITSTHSMTLDLTVLSGS